jgi:hypothetical protein
LASVYPGTVLTPYLLGWGGGTYYAFDSSGAVAASHAPASSTVAPMWSPGFWSFATYNGSAGRIIKLVSTTWSTLNISASVNTSDVWSVIGATPYSDRLILAGGTTLPDRVVFSDPGAGAWTANSYSDLPNDDGALTTGCATYRDGAIVFKENKFYVFGAESTDGSGNPQFNYRVIATGIGLVGRFASATAPEGIYFVGKDGVYLTRGDAPVKVSGALDPMFKGDSTANALGLDIAQAYISQATAAYYRERLYIAITTGASTTNNRMLVFDPKTSAWTVWSIAAASLAPHRTTVGADEQMFFGYTSGSNDIGRHFRSLTTDAGAAIPWSYKSGAYLLTKPGLSAIAPDHSVTGTGTVTLRLDTETYTNQSATATLGVSPTDAEGFASPLDNEGKFWQYTLSGSGVATVSRVTHYVSSVKPGGVQ